MNARTKITIAILIIISLLSCTDRAFNLVDDYWIYPEDEFGNGYYLICKLSSENDPKIENINTVLWNDCYIIIQQTVEERERWLIIKPSKNRLSCGCGDKIHGYYNKKYIDEFIDSCGLSFKKKILK